MVDMGVIIKIEEQQAIVLSFDGVFKNIKKVDGMFVGQNIVIQKSDIKREPKALVKFYYPVIASIAAAFLVAFLYFGFFTSSETYAYIDVDINPSLELCINKSGTVQDVKPLNVDAERIISETELKGLSLKDAVKEVVIQSKIQGYINSTQKKSLILVSASLNSDSKEYQENNGDEEKKLDTLLHELNSHFNQLDESQIEHQVIKVPAEYRKECMKYDISMGKYLIYKDLHDQGKDISIEELQSESLIDIVKTKQINLTKYALKDKTVDKEPEVLLQTNTPVLEINTPMPTHMVNIPQPTAEDIPSRIKDITTSKPQKVIVSPTTAPKKATQLPMHTSTPIESKQVLENGWIFSSIGDPSQVAAIEYHNGLFNITSGGKDIWGTKDSLAFVNQSITGDVGIVAKLISQTNTSGRSKTGIMMRESLKDDSKYIALLRNGSAGLTVQYRNITGGKTESVLLGNGTLPIYMKMIREGDSFAVYQSMDGINWGGALYSQSMSMNKIYKIGLAAASQYDGEVTIVKYDNVKFDTKSLNSSHQTLPNPWAFNNIGKTQSDGSTTYNNGEITVTSGGKGIYGTSDMFSFVNQDITGDKSITARVVPGTGEEDKGFAGIMFRSNLQPDTNFVFLGVTNENKLYMIWRNSPGVVANFNKVGSIENDGYLKLVKVNNNYIAYQSKDGVKWDFVTSLSLSLTHDIKGGLAVSPKHSEDNSAYSAKFDNVMIH